MTKKILKEYLVLLFSFSIVLLFYLWTATSSGVPFKFDWNKFNYYSYLSMSLREGRLSLPFDPDPQLLALPDPYDYRQNWQYRLHDASLFRGRYYLYFGIAPALVLYLPWNLLTGLEMQDSFAVSSFLFIGVIFSFLILRLVLEEFQIRPSAAVYSVLILILGICNLGPFILRRPDVYEVAISAGFCFVFMAFYFCLRGVKSEQRGLFWMSAGSVCMVLAIAARPILVIYSIVLFFSIFWNFRKQVSTWKNVAIRELAILVSIFIFLSSFVFIYNYLRFENIFEFGTKYQLCGHDVRKIDLFSLHYFGNNLYTYLFNLPKINLEFPYFHLLVSPSLPGIIPEPIGGIIFTAPVAVFGVFSNVFSVLHRSNLSLYFFAGFIRVSFLCGISVLLLLSCFCGITQRYVIDYLPVFLFSSIFCVFYIKDIVLNKQKLIKNIFLIVVIFLGLYSFFLSVGVSLTGYYDNLKIGNPALYDSIKSFFVY